MMMKNLNKDLQRVAHTCVRVVVMVGGALGCGRVLCQSFAHALLAAAF